MEAIEKIECVRKGLRETFTLGVEMNKGYDRGTDTFRFYSKCLEDDFAERVGVPSSQIQGVLDILVKEGFINDYKYEPIYSSTQGTSTSEFVGSVFCLHFPLSFNEKTKIVAEITFDPQSREVFYNGQRIARPNFESINYQFIEYVTKNPNITHTKDILMKEVDGYNGPNQILSDLNFKGSLRKMFFSGASVDGVYFRNPITREDLQKLKINLNEIKADMK